MFSKKVKNREHINFQFPPLERPQHWLLVICVGLNILPHANTLPNWLIIFALVTLAWNSAHLLKSIRLPKTWLANLLGVAGAIGVFVQYRTFLGQEPATAFLVFLICAKLLETSGYRHAMMVIFTCFFLLMSYLLTSQTLFSTVFLVVDAVFIVWLMFQLHKSEMGLRLQSLKPIFALLGFTTPLWVTLFILFPRFDATFLQINSNNKSRIGFSDQLNPGDVAKLSESEEPAFRVRFLKKVKLRSDELYWRGVILWHSDGLIWQKEEPLNNTRALRPQRPTTEFIEQEIILEPGLSKWLFALDTPLDISINDTTKQNNLLKKPGQIFENRRGVDQRLLYIAKSVRPEETEDTLPPEINSSALQVPELSLQTRELVGRLKSKLPAKNSDQQAIDAVLNFLQTEEFKYTLEPGLIANLDDFLFTKKKGFCEHFAAATATLLRALGVPTRVVLGFQGGVANNFSDYLLVRNLDAHAWTEVFNRQTRRWQRVDATSVVAPLRLQYGGQFNRLTKEELKFSPEEIQLKVGQPFVIQMGYKVNQFIDMASTSWNSFLLSYDFSQQTKLLESLGFKEKSPYFLALFCSLVLLLFCMVMYFYLKRKTTRTDPIARDYKILINTLRTHGVAIAQNQGPQDLYLAALKIYPNIDSELRAYLELYAAITYGRASAEHRHSRALLQTLRALHHQLNQKLKTVDIK